MAKMAEATNMYDLYDYIDIDELFQWIEEQVSEKIVKDIIDSEPMYYSVDRDMVNKFCKKYIKQMVDSFLKSNNIDVKCTEQVYDEVCREYSESYYGAEIIDKVQGELRPFATFSFDLINTNDNIGDVTDLKDEIDLGNRSGNFIIIGDKLITGNSCATHSQLINKYIEKYLHEDIDEDAGAWRVRDLDDFDGLSDDKSVVFGHIVDNMAFIETCIGYTVNEAVNILKNQGNFKKIYDYNHDNDKVTRLAKKLNNLINLDNENTDIFRKMSSMTKDEVKSYNKVLKKISKPTGRNLYDMM
jgi:hypothetical protein